ncbi:MAG: hypothetical protein ACJAZS_000452 [Alteromonas naphthalenivorans]|jgi:hypothetical protein
MEVIMNKKILSLVFVLGTLFAPAQASSDGDNPAYNLARAAFSIGYSHLTRKPAEAIECIICRDDIIEDNKFTLPQITLEDGSKACGHSFHTECFNQWTIQKMSCPCCARELTNKDPLPKYFSIQDLIDASTIPNIEDGVLDLENRGINSLNGLLNIPNIQTIIDIDLSDNSITDIQDAFTGLNNLHILNLENNQITTVQNTFTNLNSLKALVLSNNQIATIQNAFTDLNSLQVLDLGDNQITTIQGAFTDLNNLLILGLKLNNPTFTIEQKDLIEAQVPNAQVFFE